MRLIKITSNTQVIDWLLIYWLIIIIKVMVTHRRLCVFKEAGPTFNGTASSSPLHPGIWVGPNRGGPRCCPLPLPAFPKRQPLSPPSPSAGPTSPAREGFESDGQERERERGSPWFPGRGSSWRLRGYGRRNSLSSPRKLLLLRRPGGGAASRSPPPQPL